MREYSEHIVHDGADTRRYGIETLPTENGLRVQVARVAPAGPRFEVYVRGTEAGTVHSHPKVYLDGYETSVRDWATGRRKVVQ